MNLKNENEAFFDAHSEKNKLDLTRPKLGLCNKLQICCEFFYTSGQNLSLLPKKAVLRNV